jgi:hypothetical protein
MESRRDLREGGRRGDELLDLVVAQDRDLHSGRRGLGGAKLGLELRNAAAELARIVGLGALHGGGHPVAEHVEVGSGDHRGHGPAFARAGRGGAVERGPRADAHPLEEPEPPGAPDPGVSVPESGARGEDLTRLQLVGMMLDPALDRVAVVRACRSVGDEDLDLRCG